MRIVHVATNDEGGAYQAAVRINDSLNICGVESELILRNKRNKLNPGRELCVGSKRLISMFKNFLNLMISFDGVQTEVFGTDIVHEEEIKKADIIVLHWTNSFISYGMIKKLANLKKPVVWVLHDMWLITGGCHIDGYCRGYEHRCNNCPRTGSLFQKKIVRYSYERKKEVLNLLKPLLVSPSKWLAGLSGCSDITRALRSTVINNPLDLGVFYPRTADEISGIKQKYGLDENERVILFSAYKALENTNKGYMYLKEALEQVTSDGYLLLVCGSEEEGMPDRLGKVRIRCLGMIEDRDELAIINSMADVVAAPSKQENYSGSVLEALACGTPVVAFDIGGMAEIIDHLETGYIAEYENTDQLREGLLYCCDNKQRMSERAVRIRQEKNSPDIIGRRYLELFESILHRNGGDKDV